MADTDPLEYKQRRHQDLDVTTHGLTLWDLDRTFATGGFGGAAVPQAAQDPRHPARLVLPHHRRRVHAHPGPRAARVDPVQDRGRLRQDRRARSSCASCAGSTPPRRSRPSCRPSSSGRSASRSRAASRSSRCSTASCRRAAEDDLDEVCIGMPHRGRLNVLANIAGKSYGQIFREFEGKQDPRSVQGSGDVKYHLGTEGTFTAEGGATTKVYLAANPSHLEAVNPVLEGIVRAKQDRLNLAGEDFTVLPVLMHGDAAFAGQGVVAETLNLSQLRGYRTGGTVHVVINNQVGFTTSPSSSRSSTYSTDVARMIQAPIFHVNGDDPEACVRVAELAYEFRKEFHKDVVIDMVCYRRRGHNEGDDPSMTQPLMYNLIEAKRSVRKLYTESLIGRGDITVEDAEAALRDYQQQLERVFVETKAALKEAEPSRPPTAETTPAPTSRATPASSRPPPRRTPTPRRAPPRRPAISPEVLKAHRRRVRRPARRLHRAPQAAADAREARRERAARAASTGAPASCSPSAPCSWRAPRCASPARTAGAAPSCSGTPCSSTRRTAAEWTPLLYLGEGQGKFWVYDSPAVGVRGHGLRVRLLRRAARRAGAVGGAVRRLLQRRPDHHRRVHLAARSRSGASAPPSCCSCRTATRDRGPDHSSARIERFLTMCAENNMTVAYPSTPASYFHLLRRQAYARPRRPLIVFTPKSMLRLKAAAARPRTSPPARFRPVIPDRGQHRRGRPGAHRGRQGGLRPRRRARQARRHPHGDPAARAVLPAAGRRARDASSRSTRVPSWSWCRTSRRTRARGRSSRSTCPRRWPSRASTAPLRVISRAASASPATGSTKKHQAEQADLVAQAFDR